MIVNFICYQWIQSFISSCVSTYKEQEGWREKTRSSCCRVFAMCTLLILSCWGSASTWASLSRKKGGRVWTVPQGQHVATTAAAHWDRCTAVRDRKLRAQKLTLKGSSQSKQRSSNTPNPDVWYNPGPKPCDFLVRLGSTEGIIKMPPSGIPSQWEACIWSCRQ